MLVAGVTAFAVSRLTAARPAVEQPAPLSAEAEATAHAFVDEAVARKDPRVAWGLASPSLRQGMTPKQWATGTIPVVPYPVDKARLLPFRVETSFNDRATLQVTFVPKPGAKAAGASFDLVLVKLHGRWYVDAWSPRSAIGAHR